MSQHQPATCCRLPPKIGSNGLLPLPAARPLPLSSGRGSCLSLPCSSEEMEGLGPSPHCPQSWMNGCNLRGVALFLGWVPRGKWTHKGQWSL